MAEAKPRATGFSPVDALRLIRAILGDESLSKAERIVAAEVVLCLSNRTGEGWASYQGIRNKLGVSFDAIAGALRSDGGKAIGRYLEIAGHGKRGAVRYRALRLPERSEGPSALRAPVSIAPGPSVQRSDQRRQTSPINSPHKLTPAAEAKSSTPDAVAEVVTALKAHGIAEREARRLAVSIPGLTTEIVEHIGDRASSGDHPAGLMVHLLRTEGKELVERVQRGEKLDSYSSWDFALGFLNEK